MSLPLGEAGSRRPTRYGQIYPPDPGWLARQEPEAVLLPDLPIVDPHHHVWDLPGFRYGLADYAADAASGHNVVATVYADAGVRYRPDGPEALRPVGETAYAAGLAAESRGGRHGPVRVASGMFGYADLTLGGAVEAVIEAHLAAGDGRFKGVRYAANWDASDAIANYKPTGRPDILADPKVRAGLAVLARHGLVWDSLAWFTQAGQVAAAADAVPDLTVVVEHCGGPLGYGPYAGAQAETFARWKAGITEIARRPNTRCKLGGLLIRAAAYDYIAAATPPASAVLAEAWRPWIETCIEAFGARRCMFESNFPLEKIATNWVMLWNAFKRIAHGASDEELRALFAGTAARTYRIEDDLAAGRMRAERADAIRPPAAGRAIARPA